MKILIDIKLKDIIGNIENFSALNQNKMRGKTAYKVARILTELQIHLEDYNTVRGRLLSQYGKPTSELINQYTIPDENILKFNQELEELLNEQVQLNCAKINIDEFEDVELTPGQMTALLPFIEE